MNFELIEHHRNIPNDELLSDIKRVATILGKNSLTRDEYSQHGRFGYNTYLRRFGSWNSVLEICGLDVTPFQRAAANGGHYYSTVTDEQLISDMVRVSQLLNSKTFSCGKYQEYGEYSKSTYFRRFGSWNAALEAAGLTPFEKVSGRKIPTENLIQEIERTWIKLGRQPTTTDIKAGASLYSLNTYTRHFGSWKNALGTFVEYVNRDETRPPLKAEHNSHHSECYNNAHGSAAELIKKHKTPREPNLRQRFKVMQRDNFKCRFCGASPANDPSIELHIDHIIPWSKGGETVIDNLQTLCSKCNLGKSDIEE